MVVERGIRWLRRQLGWPEVSQGIEKAVDDRAKEPPAAESGGPVTIPGSQPVSEPASEPVTPPAEPTVASEPTVDQGVGEEMAQGVLPEAPEPVDGAEDRVPDRATPQDGQTQPTASYVFTKHDRCTTCYRPDVDDIHAAFLNGQSVRAVSRERHIPFQSLRRHLKHVRLLNTGREAEHYNAQTRSVDSWGLKGSEKPPEGTDPLLWELSQLRQIAQGALDYAGKTRNLTATASLLRSANGLLDLLARIEKAKAEELKAQQATVALQDERALEEEFNQHLDRLAERLEQSQAMQQPPADVQEPQVDLPEPDGTVH